MNPKLPTKAAEWVPLGLLLALLSMLFSVKGDLAEARLEASAAVADLRMEIQDLRLRATYETKYDAVRWGALVEVLP